MFFEKINKIDKPLAKLTRGQRESIQINKIRKESGDIITETGEIQEIIRSYYKSLYSTKLENLEEMDKFLDRYKILNLNQDQVNHLNNPITPKEIEQVINRLPTKKSPVQMGSMQNFIRHLLRTYHQYSPNYSTRKNQMEYYLTHYFEATIILVPKPYKDLTK